ncbi:glutamate--tRNA ligase [Candidatus Woesearchaeota archaeon]|nr:glutamate--tRNA ligase [Candidatus Woesearchaeota archaeon]
MDLRATIRKFALQNAIKYNGKANPGNIIGKILGTNPELRTKSKEVMKEIQAIVKIVNAMPLEEQVAELNNIAPELLTKKEEKKQGLPDLPGAVDNKVVTRIPPEPSKYNHIGHALSFLINYMYAKKYHGKSILRFEDTNPEKATQEFVDAMKEDCIEYLDIQPDETKYVSDDMQIFYDLAEELINKEKAYVCFCSRDEMQKLRHKGKPCKHRDTKPAENLKHWKDMLDKKYKEGEAVLRLKGDMESGNHVMRDPVIFRIVYTPHYRQKKKYHVWPMYDFENAVEENICGVTHIMRSNEFGKMRVDLQDYIKDLFGFPKQIAIQYGRFNVTGACTQGREIRKLIEEKKVIGWDDPSLVTLKALKRRGIKKEMFYELINEVGLSPSQTNIDWSIISSINRKILDPIAHRYFFVEDPQKIKIEGAPEQKITLDLHPDNKKGGRKLTTKDTFLINKTDLKDLKQNKLHRLMDCLNFEKKKDKYIFHSKSYEGFKDAKNKGKIIHWLPESKDLINAEIFMPDHSTRKGLTEPAASKLKPDTVIQFERTGFVRLDEKQKTKLKFWFTHK